MMSSTPCSKAASSVRRSPRRVKAKGPSGNNLIDGGPDVIQWRDGRHRNDPDEIRSLAALSGRAAAAVVGGDRGAGSRSGWRGGGGDGHGSASEHDSRRGARARGAWRGAARVGPARPGARWRAQAAHHAGSDAAGRTGSPRRTGDAGGPDVAVALDLQEHAATGRGAQGA